MADVISQDQPCIGQILSLANVPSRVGAGIRIKRPDASVNITTGLEVLHSNPNRLWALIQNCGSDVVYFCFDVNSGVGATFRLPVGGILQIDKNLPWWGAVYIAATTGQVNWMEAEVVSE